MISDGDVKTRSRVARRVASALALALLLASASIGALGGCAASGFVADPNPMPAARATLRPEYRLFYDALTDYGDWKLVEPYGYAFRPRVAVDLWDPYQDGFWSPTDIYGWVWMSAEPFGWATYHYGRWFRDDYQGWVWVPGLDWAPAWVSWAADDQYVAWAPLAPGRDFDSAAPANSYTVVPRASMGSTDLATHTLSVDRLGARADALHPVANLDRAEGVVFNRGPRVDWVEQVRGPLLRARVQDLVPGRSVAQEPKTGPATSPRHAEDQRIAEQAAQRTRQMMQLKSASPEVLQMVRPFAPAGTPADTARVAEPGKSPPRTPARKKSVRGGG